MLRCFSNLVRSRLDTPIASLSRTLTSPLCAMSSPTTAAHAAAGAFSEMSIGNDIFEPEQKQRKKADSAPRVTPDRPKKVNNKNNNNKSKRALLARSGGVWPPPYYFEDGLRKLEPYPWTYNTNCKERWRGRRLIDIFESEFRDRPLSYYRDSMERGTVMVNGEVVGPEYVLVNGDTVSHTLHRHEPPVTPDPIGVIHEDDDMIVINKPAGVPVHAAGRYKYNSVLEIMRAERGKNFRPYPCNRLDRLTSGIMFVAKNPKAAVKLGEEIFARSVRKEYIARVAGEFPDGEVVCNQPILVISPKLGLNRVRATGKHAKTVFKKLAYYPPLNAGQQEPEHAPATDDTKKPWKRKYGYSIVRCLPVTGRTHQLRVHLQFLGHPIQNDPIYANQRVWGLDLGSSDADGSVTSDEDVISRLSKMGKEEVAEAVEYYDEMVDEYEKKRAEKMNGLLCEVCATPLYSDPGPHELRLYLHSLRYEDSGGKWAYKSELPKWALPPQGRDGPTNVGGLDELVEAGMADGSGVLTPAESHAEDDAPKTSEKDVD